MKVVCAWCGVTIEDGPDNGEISHGCCDACYKRYMADIDARKEKQPKRGLKLFLEFILGRHWVVREREVLV